MDSERSQAMPIRPFLHVCCREIKTLGSYQFCDCVPTADFEFIITVIITIIY